MFFAFQNRRRLSTLLSRAALIALLSWTAALPGRASAEPCAPVDLQAGDTWRADGTTDDGGCFAVTVAERGRLAVELISPVDGPETRLALHCSSTLPWTRRLSHTPSHLHMEAVPGVYRFRVRPIDPDAPMPAFRVQSRFAPGAPTKGEDDHELEIEVDPLLAATCLEDPTKGEDDHELEIEVDPLLWPASPPTKGEDDHELEIEVDPLVAAASCEAPTKGEDDHELEIEVDPLVAQTGSLCVPNLDDDHSDGTLCAAPLTVDGLGARIHGELSNDWGDDQDVYAFTLKRPSTVRLTIDALLGSVSTALYDADGQRVHHLARRNGWVRRLKAGTYHLRLDGDHGTPYDLGLQLLR